MKRIGWIRTHGLLHRKTIFIIPFGEVLRTKIINTFFLYFNVLKKVTLFNGETMWFEPTNIVSPNE